MCEEFVNKLAGNPAQPVTYFLHQEGDLGGSGLIYVSHYSYMIQIPASAPHPSACLPRKHDRLEGHFESSRAP